MNNADLSIFVDELGDFGKYDIISPYYIIALVFHEQSISINDEIDKFDAYLSEIGLRDIIIHTGPIIRRENIYRNIDKTIRKKLINRFVAFVKKLDIKYTTIVIDKKHINDVTELSGKLSKEISVFINNNIDFFNNRNEIKVYYDNGQVELSKIIYSTFNIMLKNVVSKRVMPKDYKLFQVADLFCTITNLELKIRNNNLSNSDHIILGNEKDIKKNIINKLKDKKFNK